MNIIFLSIAITSIAFGIYTIKTQREYTKKEFYKRLIPEILIGIVFLYLAI